MFNLTKGILKEIKSRGFINGQSITENENVKSKVILRNYETLIMVKVTKINFHKQTHLVTIRLFDGQDYVECCLDSNSWNCLNKNDFLKFFNRENIEPVREDKCIQLGSVLILNEYSFMDVFIDANQKEEDMLVILKYSCVGLEKTSEEVVDDKIEHDKNASNTNLRIATLSPNLNNLKWSIVAKLIKVSVIKEFVNKNTCQDGKYIRLQFADETGFVELVAFNQEIDKTNNLVEERIYKISNADIKISKGSVNAFQETSDSKIELVVNKRTIIVESMFDVKYFKIFSKQENSNVNEAEKQLKTDKYKENGFVILSELHSKKEGTFVNAIGIVSREDEIREVTPKFKSPIKLKNFYICDETCDEIKVSLWGKQADSFTTTRGCIYMLNKVKLTNYNGSIGLSVLLESHITKIEDNWDHIDLANDLRKWWQEKSVNEICSTLKRTTTLEEVSLKKFKE